MNGQVLEANSSTVEVIVARDRLTEEITRDENQEQMGMHTGTAGLGCTDAAPRPAHPRPTRRDVVTREGRRRPCVRDASCHVAIPESGRRGPNRADSVRIGRIGLYRPKRPR